MRIRVYSRDGVVQAEGLAKEIHELLGILIERQAPRITLCVIGTKASLAWGLDG